MLIVSIPLIVIASVGYLIVIVAIFRFRNERILIHFISPAMGISLWCTLLYASIYGKNVIQVVCLILLSMYCIPKTVQKWMRNMMQRYHDNS